jgi:hypothetical protein
MVIDLNIQKTNILDIYDTSGIRALLELVPTLMIDDLDKSCAKAAPNFDK